MQCVRRTSAVHPIGFSRSTYPIVVEEAQRPAPPTSEMTVTLLDQSWLDKEYEDRRNQEIREFTHKTGIRVRVLPSPEAPIEPLATWMSLLGRESKIPDVYALDMIWLSNGHEKFRWSASSSQYVIRQKATHLGSGGPR